MVVDLWALGTGGLWILRRLVEELGWDGMEAGCGVVRDGRAGVAAWWRGGRAEGSRSGCCELRICLVAGGVAVGPVGSGFVWCVAEEGWDCVGK